jgi:CheY-like chemotaxis protein
MTTILVIDDDDILLDAIAEVLSYEGYDILTASSGDEGLLLAQQQCPSIIICDWMIPKLKGYDVFKALQADYRTASIPYLLISGYSDIVTIQRLTGIVPERIFSKPFDIPRLLATVKQITSLSVN